MSKECVICFEEKSCICCSICNTFFHLECFIEYNKENCPTCKTKLPLFKKFKQIEKCYDCKKPLCGIIFKNGIGCSKITHDLSKCCRLNFCLENNKYHEDEELLDYENILIKLNFIYKYKIYNNRDNSSHCIEHYVYYYNPETNILINLSLIKYYLFDTDDEKNNFKKYLNTLIKENKNLEFEYLRDKIDNINDFYFPNYDLIYNLNNDYKSFEDYDSCYILKIFKNYMLKPTDCTLDDCSEICNCLEDGDIDITNYVYDKNIKKFIEFYLE